MLTNENGSTAFRRQRPKMATKSLKRPRDPITPATLIEDIATRQIAAWDVIPAAP
jgi:hypothetical protein